MPRHQPACPSWLQVPSADLPWCGAPSALAAQLVRLLQAGWPSPFLLLFDEVWAMVEQLRPTMAAATGNAVNMDILAWYVDPNKGHSGFSPHRDRQPRSARSTFRPQASTRHLCHACSRVSACGRCRLIHCTGDRHARMHASTTCGTSCSSSIGPMRGQFEAQADGGQQSAVSQPLCSRAVPHACMQGAGPHAGGAMYTTAWVPLTDACPENSCLYVVPRCAAARRHACKCLRVHAHVHAVWASCSSHPSWADVVAR